MPLTVIKRATSGGSLKSAGGSNTSLDRINSYGSDSNLAANTYDNEFYPISLYDGGDASEELLRAVAMTSAERSALVLQMLDVVSSDVQTMGALSSIADLTALTKHFGLCDVSVGSKVLEGMTKMINSTSPSREAGLLLFKCLLLRVGRRMEPFCIQLLPKVLSMVADRIQAVRDLAQSISNEMTLLMNPYAFRTLLPILLKAMTDEDWRVKVVALSFLKQISPRVSRQVSPLLPEIIPAVTECIISTKPQVQQAGLDTLTEACRAISNDDIRHLVPQLVSVIARPDESESTLNALLETTFVATVDAPTLALIAPTLGKALRTRSSPLKRKAARIIDNMCRLVTDPSDVAPFGPMLLPALNKVIDEIVDAEVRDVSIAARTILLRAMGEGKVGTAAAAKQQQQQQQAAAVEDDDASNAPEKYVFTRAFSLNLTLADVKAKVAQTLKQTLGEPLNAAAAARDMTIVSSYVVEMLATLLVHDTVTSLVDIKSVDIDLAVAEPWRVAVAMSNSERWKDCVVPYATELQDGGAGADAATTFAEKLNASLRTNSLDGLPDAAAARDAEDGSLCDFEFSLAFGGKILLHQTRLRLGKGRRYGIMGKNGAGKTTLLTNIGSGNIEGLPPHLKTVYVQHDDASDDNGVPLMDELLAGKDMVEVNVTREEATTALKNINFTDEMLSSPRNNLSGGWKMKLLIIRAMLSRANVLLLDEVCFFFSLSSLPYPLTNLSQSLTPPLPRFTAHEPSRPSKCHVADQLPTRRQGGDVPHRVARHSLFGQRHHRRHSLRDA